MSGMDMGAHQSGVDGHVLAVVLRLLLLVGSAVAGGTGLLRPALAVRPGRRAVAGAAAGAVVAAAAGVASLVALPVVVPVAVAQIALVLALPAVLARPVPAAGIGAALGLLVLVETLAGDFAADGVVAVLTDVVFVAAALVGIGVTVLAAGRPRWRDGVRPGRITALAGAVLALTGVVRLSESGIGLDRRIYSSAVGLLLVAAVVLPVVAAVVVGLRRAVAVVATAGTVLALSAWTAAGALPQPPAPPTPGVPLLSSVPVGEAAVPVLVTPQRPGRNLVHFPPGAGADLAVATGDGPLVRAVPRPGAEGTWAEVDLPAGRGELMIHSGRGHGTLQVDAGDGPGIPAASGADGPECAGAALGGLVAGRHDVLTRCPADGLEDADADALRRLVGVLASRSVPGIAVAADGSPRSRQAAEVVRRAAADAHLPVRDSPENALVVVSGWADAAPRLHALSERQASLPTYAQGVYLAPWLLHAPVVNEALTSFLPLRFNPRDAQSLEYSVALENGFGGENPSASGFRDWLRARRDRPADAVTLYASAQVSAMPMEIRSPDMADMSMGGDYPGQWVPGGTIVPVSGTLH
ncbi:hypothetical protein [Saccharopolyspora rosea]|uniref:hypothetical protein n=1 Tax=Saccharopolyspora rosea TaxID=524884 RepID=UPI0021D843E0|nr:hypothetical protein [Saccharopolyspora rosea]